MNTNLMFKGDANTMAAFKKKGKPGSIALIVTSVLTVLIPLLCGIMQLIASILVTVFSIEVEESGMAIMGMVTIGASIWGIFGGLFHSVVLIAPFLLLIVGYFRNQKALLAAGAIVNMVLSAGQVISEIIGIVSIVINVAGSIATGGVVDGYSLAASVLIFLTSLVGIVAAAPLLYLVLFMEKKEKISGTLAIVLQVVALVLNLLAVVVYTAQSIDFFIYMLDLGGIVSALVLVMFDLAVLLNQFVPIVICIGTLVFAVGILRTKKAAAEEAEVEEATEVAETEEGTEEAVEAAEESAPVAEGEAEQAVEETVETSATEA